MNRAQWCCRTWKLVLVVEPVYHSFEKLRLQHFSHLCDHKIPWIQIISTPSMEIRKVPVLIQLFHQHGKTFSDEQRVLPVFTCFYLCQLATHWNYTMYARICATVLKNTCWIGSCMQSCTKQGWNFLVLLFNIHNYKRAWVCLRSH